MHKIWQNIGWLFLLPSALCGAGISYSVQFEGMNDPKVIRALRSISQLVALRKKEPSSLNALRFRADSDIPDLVKLLHAHGYFEAEVDVQIVEDHSDYYVMVQIQPGPLYRVESFRVHIFSPMENSHITPEFVQQEALCVGAGEPANTQLILDSELAALCLLSECGYPLATIKDREIIADGKTKRVTITLTLDTGPLAHFGQTTIEGNTSVRPLLIERKIDWIEGEQYDSSLVDSTQQSLMDTGLFSSVFITHGESLAPDAELPVKIDVAETKHKSISVGASFQTTYGGGATIGWEHRNVGGMGRKFTFQADIAERTHSGLVSYLIPDFHEEGQNYTILAQATHETLKPYHQQSYSVLNRFDWQVNPYFYFSAGAQLEYLLVTNSVDNGNFFLAEVPLYVRWTDVCDFLNPLSGIRFDYRAVPSANIKDISEFYLWQMATLCTYLPLWSEERLILAQKISVGSILSNGLGAVPVPKRFFGGSENNLRGYKYYTVSPLDDDDKPIGGRSAVFYSLEPRFRLTKSFGIVPFFDMGNVYLEQLPKWSGKWRKSLGIGLRYFSLFGPLRLDVAFPLNRREGIDPHWWIFVSLGQTF